MKKFSFIAGLGCLATVGGVFAAWTFGEFQIVSPSGQLRVNSITVENEFETKYQIAATATATDAAYYFKQNSTHDGLVMERTSESGAANDVNIKVAITGADKYSNVTTHHVWVRAVAQFTAIDEEKSSLNTLEGALGTSMVAYEEYDVQVSKENPETTVGFKLDSRNVVNKSYEIKNAEDCQKYIDALENTQLSYKITIQNKPAGRD